MKELYPLLKKIEPRVAMWTGERTLKCIQAFVNGYFYALHELQLDVNTNDDTIDFHDWIAQKLGYNESTAGWANMILAASLDIAPHLVRWEQLNHDVTRSQHNTSVDLFFSLLERYMKESNQK